MMFEKLYLFLIRYRQVELPGIGVVSLQIQPAKTKFIDREVLPPAYFFQFSTREKSTTSKLSGWIAHAWNISETDADSRFNDFISGIRRQLQEGKEVVWAGVGKFSKDLMNEIKFEPQKRALAFQQPVIAEKVIRENARHAVLVGEREKTASEYSEIIEESAEVTTPRTNWWIWPTALIILSLIFIGWYFSENGVRASSSSNTEKSIPKEAPPAFYFSK
jgi:nucleoid DNA-binding protein